MKKVSLKIKIISGMLCTGLALSGSITFAAVQNNTSAKLKLASSMDVRVPIDKEKHKQEIQEEMKATLESVIKDSVVSGSITKDEGDKVLEYVKTKHLKGSVENKEDKKCKNEKCKNEKCKGERGGLFSDLVTEGILTQKKSDALRERMYVKNTELRNEQLQKGLKTLVISKVLTVEQSIKVKDAIMAREAERKEDFKKMRDMKENDKKDYMKKIKNKKINPIKVLVENGTLTKAQEKEIQKILPHHKHHHKK